MNQISNFLWKLFSVFVVFGYNTNNKAYGFTPTTAFDKTVDTNINIDINIDNPTQQYQGGQVYPGVENFDINNNDFQQYLDGQGSGNSSSGSGNSSSNTDNTPASTPDTTTTDEDLLTIYSSSKSLSGSRRVEICPAGYYVSKCGNFAVGYNWLKNAYVNNEQTNNYATTSNDPVTQFDQMRRFFKGQYLKAWVVNEKTGEIDTTKTPQTKSIDDRDTILGAICNPNNVKKDANFSYSCAPCPEAGTVGPSYVHTDYSSSTLLIPHSWKFHSIADCYLSEFEDATGSFIYSQINFDTSTAEKGQACYYGDSISTSDFKKYFMGSSIGSVRTDTAVSAPAQKYEDSPNTSN